MAVTYDKISYSEIELGLRKIINDEFRNVYIGNNFYHDGTNHKPIYEDQVSGIQFRAGTIRFRTAGVTGLHENLDAGGGTERMRITSDGSVGIGTNTPTGFTHLYTSQRYML